MVGERLAGSNQSATGAGPQPVVNTADRSRTVGQAAGQATARKGGNVARGVGGFLRPFRRVGGIVWLEVTGVFFLLFVPVFVWRGMWHVRSSYAHGPHHWEFLGYAALAALFLYLGVSSFWRARRK
jgi:hypothetical protein